MLEEKVIGWEAINGRSNFSYVNSIHVPRNDDKRRQVMGKMKDFIFDFLDVANNDLRDKYRKKDWDWDNLPHFEKMVSVIKEGKDKKRNGI